MDPQQNSPQVIRIALAGQPNVGKSVIFNQLTGLSQTIGNWPGKTVAKAEGTARFQNYVFKIVDLPGIYSLSTYSLEEIVSRDYILNEQPDYIINVVDASHLERNLFFTLQLSLLNRPMIISLNQVDLLQERGYEIDTDQLSSLLQTPVIPCVAVHNRGVHEILEQIIELEKEKTISHEPSKSMYEPKFGKEIETRLQKIIKLIPDGLDLGNYPPKFLAIKLLENDDESIRILSEKNPSQETKIQRLLYFVEEIRENLVEIHGEDIGTILNAELYNIGSQIIDKVLQVQKINRKKRWNHYLDHITLDNFTGYIFFFGLMLAIYFGIFKFGDWVSTILDLGYNSLSPSIASLLGGESNWIYKIIWVGIAGGLIAGVGGVLPYVIPFFIVIEILQDTGYLPRAAYLMDRFMHHLGVHGKTIIPILIGFGCNVPAVSASMIMETEKEKRRAIIISSMIPCAAVTTIVMGLVAKFLGFWWAILIYVINFAVIILIGKLLTKLDKDNQMDSELIIELHDFRKPNFQVILKQTWHRSKEFIVMALPLIVLLGIILQILLEFNLLSPINSILAPITVFVLGLPVEVGIYLFYGVLRKELNLVLLEVFVASLALTIPEFMTPLQIFIFTLVTMLYIPCLATIITIKKETNWKFALQVMGVQILIAVIFGGLINWGSKLFKFIFP